MNGENWYPSYRKINSRICKECEREQKRVWLKANPEKSKEYQARWRKVNPEKAKESSIRGSRKTGCLPMGKNRECSSFFGIHIAERVLSRVFKNVKRMPVNNPGYDVICSRDKKIDIKSSCLHKNGCWCFNITCNTTADFFLCLAFDNREDLNPLHAWLIPGGKVNHRAGVTISPTTLHKWDAYRLDTTKISACCDTLRG